MPPVNLGPEYLATSIIKRQSPVRAPGPAQGLDLKI